MVDLFEAISDTVDVSAAITRVAYKTRIFDTVGIVDDLRKDLNRPVTDTVGITAAFDYAGDLVQMDTWRPVNKPDNSLILVCRTPLGEHDSYTGLTNLTLWTIVPDGTQERTAVLSPADNGYGWDSYSHPEWSPSGEDIVVAAETSTEYQLVVLDATGFGS